jgi:hypothetical protein
MAEDADFGLSLAELCWVMCAIDCPCLLPMMLCGTFND